MSLKAKILILISLCTFATCSIDKISLADDAEALYSALNVSPVDTKTIINILGKRTLAQRLALINEYRDLTGRDVVEIFKDKLPTADLRDLVVPMMTPSAEYYASELNYAVVGLGTDEEDLVEILTTLTKAEILAVRRSYHQLYDAYLEDDIKDDTSSYFKDLLVSLVRAERDESAVTDPEQAVADASAMYNAQSDDRWRIFSNILEHRSWAQLRLIFAQFDKLSPNGIEKEIQADFSGDVQLGLLGIVKSVLNRPKYFAKRLYDSMAGWGTADRDLVRVVVTRNEIDINDIKIEYAAAYSNTLADDIIDDTSGDYMKLLLILIGEEDARKSEKTVSMPFIRNSKVAKEKRQ